MQWICLFFLFFFLFLTVMILFAEDKVISSGESIKFAGNILFPFLSFVLVIVFLRDV